MKSAGQVIGKNLNMTLAREEACKGCGENLKIYEMPIVGGPRKGELEEITYGCKCEDRKLAEEAWKKREQIKLQKIRENFDRYSLINKKLQKATLDNFDPKNQTQAYAKRTTKRFVEVFDPEDPRNLLFCGGYGVGKSHLAKTVTDGVIKKGFTAIFISVPKLMRKLRASYGKDSEITEDEIFAMLEQVDLLVLDDLGAEKHSDWAEEKVFDLIDSRQGMSTIYTSNYSPEDLEYEIGERNFSRVINEDTTIVEIEGENHRLADIRKQEE